MISVTLLYLVIANHKGSPDLNGWGNRLALDGESYKAFVATFNLTHKQSAIIFYCFFLFVSPLTLSLSLIIVT